MGAVPGGFDFLFFAAGVAGDCTGAGAAGFPSSAGAGRTGTCGVVSGDVGAAGGFAGAATGGVGDSTGRIGGAGVGL